MLTVLIVQLVHQGLGRRRPNHKNNFAFGSKTQIRSWKSIIAFDSECLPGEKENPKAQIRIHPLTIISTCTSRARQSILRRKWKQATNNVVVGASFVLYQIMITELSLSCQLHLFFGSLGFVQRLPLSYGEHADVDSSKQDVQRHHHVSSLYRFRNLCFEGTWLASL